MKLLTDKTYLGDSVYCQFDGAGLILTTENGLGPTNTIYLESEVMQKLVEFDTSVMQQLYLQRGMVPPGFEPTKWYRIVANNSIWMETSSLDEIKDGLKTAKGEIQLERLFASSPVEKWFPYTISSPINGKVTGQTPVVSETDGEHRI